MPRIRSIHPGLFTDDAFMALSPYAMAAWPGIWIQADDQGIFEWKPLTLKARLLPCALIDMRDLLVEYEAQGLVHRFEANGHSYGAIRNFRRYQRPERPKIVYPLPENLRVYVGLAPTDHADVQTPIEHRQNTDRTPIEHRHVDVQTPTKHRKPPQRKEVGDKMEEEGKNLHHPPPDDSVAARSPATTGRPPPGRRDEDEGLREFDEFWETYPRKVNRGRTREAWIIARNTQPAEQLLAAAQRYAAENAGKQLSLVARPENWLRDQRWLDQPNTDFAQPNGAEQPITWKPGSPGHWRHRMQLWFDERNGGPHRTLWPQSWGPPPGDPECQVPPDVLAEFHLPP